MPKNKKIKSYILYSLHIPVLILAAVVVTVGYIGVNKNSSNSNVLSSKNEGKGNDKGGGSSNSNSKGKSDNSNKDKSENQDTSKAINTEEHKEKVQNVVTTLEKVAKTETTLGNKKASETINEVATEVKENISETDKVIENLDNLPKWQTFLIGTDYKNLGQLRSSLAHNTNSIRKLTTTMEGMMAGEDKTAIEEQLAILNAEKERITAVIQKNESNFSVLGWAFRFLSGYSNDSSKEVVPESSESTESL